MKNQMEPQSPEILMDDFGTSYKKTRGTEAMAAGRGNVAPVFMMQPARLGKL